MSRETCATTDAILLGETGLSLRLSGEALYFNHFWLRDNCPTSFDPQTRERIFDISTPAEPPRPLSATLEGEASAATSGERHLRGCYIDRGELRSTVRTLLRQLDCAVA